MRNLTAQQKKALQKDVVDFCNENHSFPANVEDLKHALDIDNMNPCEVFWQNANRFIDDLKMSGKFNYIFQQYPKRY